MLSEESHQKFMQEALEQAREAWRENEVPVGAVLVRKGQIIARAHNLVRTRKDPTAHAEILVLQEGARQLANERLSDTALYVTIEPCAMCGGAMVWARIKRLVYGTRDPKAGAAGSVVNVVQNPRFNHRLEVLAGVLEEDCRELMESFFQPKRKNEERSRSG